MFALLLATVAHAEELPLPSTAPALPYRVEVVGTGKSVNLIDPRGNRVDLEDALVLVGKADQIDAVHSERLTRTLGSVACWVVGGGMLVGSTFVATYTGESLPADTQLATMAGGAALVGGGFIVRFVGRKNDLGDWVDTGTVTSAVAAHNALFVGPPAPAAEPGQPPVATVPPPTEWVLRVDEDGRVRDYRNRVVNVPELAKALRDQDLAQEYASGRRMDKAIYFTTLGVGGAVVVVSMGAFVVGFFDWAFIDETRGESLMLTSLGTGALGGLAVGGGVTGLVVSKKMRSDTRNWFDSLTIQQKVDAYNAGLGGSATPLPATQPVLFELHPIVSPTMIGLTGTF